MSVAQVLGYVTAIAQDWGLMPYIQAGILFMVVIGTFVGLRRLFNGS